MTQIRRITKMTNTNTSKIQNNIERGRIIIRIRIIILTIIIARRRTHT